MSFTLYCTFLFETHLLEHVSAQNQNRYGYGFPFQKLTVQYGRSERLQLCLGSKLEIIQAIGKLSDKHWKEKMFAIQKKASFVEQMAGLSSGR